MTIEKKLALRKKSSISIIEKNLLKIIFKKNVLKKSIQNNFEKICETNSVFNTPLTIEQSSSSLGSLKKFVKKAEKKTKGKCIEKIHKKKVEHSLN